MRIVIVLACSIVPKTLSEVLPGTAATIVALHVGQEYGRRMAGLGLRPGVSVRVIRISPLRGPLQVRAGHTDLILRRSDAARIEVRAVA
ncbi:MAG: ferrous iron transport protein A [Thiobacillaceae bacterium]|jgi:ferrous iron transport protein A|nr:ferrous iron transport protein A [Thiobacillaceae bacterium]